MYGPMEMVASTTNTTAAVKVRSAVAPAGGVPDAGVADAGVFAAGAPGPVPRAVTEATSSTMTLPLLVAVSWASRMGSR